MTSTPIDAILDAQRVIILDGGLATELENRGHDLGHPLWSARLLLTNPRAILEVHRSYLEAGANCLISASYQASIPALRREGLSDQQAHQAIRRSVELAMQARDEYLDDCRHRQPTALRPFVAASVGPYAAMLADGSEYRGDYDVSQGQLLDFHQSRWEALIESGADILACETIPSFEEAEVLVQLLRQTPAAKAWISFSCRNGQRISDGTPIGECAVLVEDCPQVIAVGVNCTAPMHILSLIDNVRLGAPGKRVIVYPNSGQIYDPRQKIWRGNRAATDFGMLACRWYNRGATLIGGCCQTGPQHIRSIRDALLNLQPKSVS